MTAIAMVKAPMLSVDRDMFGAPLAEAQGNINGVPLRVTVTNHEIFIAWVDRKGPAFAIQINPLIKAAVTEIEALLGVEGRHK